MRFLSENHGNHRQTRQARGKSQNFASNKPRLDHNSVSLARNNKKYAKPKAYLMGKTKG